MKTKMTSDKVTNSKFINNQTANLTNKIVI